MKFEPSVKMFYDGLAEGKILAKRCKECGHIEFPPKPACNTCGYHETEWCEISGKAMLRTIILPSMMSARPFLDEYGKDHGGYCFGDIEIVEGDHINGVCFGGNRKNRNKIQEIIDAEGGVPCTAFIFDRPEGYKTVYFELDELD